MYIYVYIYINMLLYDYKYTNHIYLKTSLKNVLVKNKITQIKE